MMLFLFGLKNLNNLILHRIINRSVIGVLISKTIEIILKVNFKQSMFLISKIRRKRIISCIDV